MLQSTQTKPSREVFEAWSYRLEQRLRGKSINGKSAPAWLAKREGVSQQTIYNLMGLVGGYEKATASWKTMVRYGRHVGVFPGAVRVVPTNGHAPKPKRASSRYDRR